MKSKKIPSYIQLFLTAIGLLSSDIHVSALPIIATYFHISGLMAQSSIMLFFCGTILSVALFGFASDIYGRKPLVLLSIVFSILGSIVCAFSTKYPLFLLGRGLQGLGAGGINIIGFAIIQDCLNVKESSRILSFLGTLLILIPTLSPLIGGYILEALGWQAIFQFMIILSALALVIAITLLPETLMDRKQKFNFNEALQEIKFLTKYPRFLKVILIYPIASIGYWAFITKSSFIFNDVYHLNIQTYKYLISLLVFIFAIGCFVSQFIIKYCTLSTTVKLGTFIALIGALVNIINFHPNYYFFILGNGLYLFAIGIIYAPSTALSFSIYDGARGLVSSFRASFIMLSSLIGSLFAQAIPDSTIYILSLLISATSIVIFALSTKIFSPINQMQ
ncbi:MAG: MFS transporter [Gammaproteobacteria bacterium]